MYWVFDTFYITMNPNDLVIFASFWWWKNVI